MKVDAGVGFEFGPVKETAQSAEALGYDGVSTAELAHDPFLPALLAAEHTNRVDIMTSIAVAFARNPMTTAVLGHDLNSFSQGRFVLGLGSQISAHITRRFSMPWSKPAARMKEYIEAMHAIWDCWYDGKPLNFRGDFYTHTIMTPYFTPTDSEHGRPRIIVAAVGPLMTEIAAEVADGVLCHAFTTERYIREVTLPIIENSLKKCGRSREGFQVVCPFFTVIADDEKAVMAGKTASRKHVAFYASTPAYKGVLDLHGWGDLQPELNRLSKEGRWDDMATLIEEDVLDAFSIIGTAEEVVATIKSRFGDLVDRTSLAFPGLERARVQELISRLQARS